MLNGALFILRSSIRTIFTKRNVLKGILRIINIAITSLVIIIITIAIVIQIIVVVILICCSLKKRMIFLI